MEQMRQCIQLDMFEDMNLLFTILTAVERNALSCTGLFIDMSKRLSSLQD